jgi:hypothetical protein
VATGYTVEVLEYRFRATTLMEGVGAENGAVDLLVRLFESIAHRLSLRRYERTGFTLVLRKPSAVAAASGTTRGSGQPVMDGAD